MSKPVPRPAAQAAKAAHEVRIIGGQWKRSKLPVADRPGLRPTPSRVRETLLRALQAAGHLQDRVVGIPATVRDRTKG